MSLLTNTLSTLRQLIVASQHVRIYAGYSGMIRIFDTASPGRSYRTLSTKDIGAKGTLSLSLCVCVCVCVCDLSASPERSNPLRNYYLSTRHCVVYDVQSGLQWPGGRGILFGFGRALH
jgi:hypothetical protein